MNGQVGKMTQRWRNWEETGEAKGKMQWGKEHGFCASVFHSNQTNQTEHPLCEKDPLNGSQFSQHYWASAVGTSGHRACIVSLNLCNTGEQVSHPHLADEETEGGHTAHGIKLGFWTLSHWTLRTCTRPSCLMGRWAGQDRRTGLALKIRWHNSHARSMATGNRVLTRN